MLEGLADNRRKVFRLHTATQNKQAASSRTRPVGLCLSSISLLCWLAWQLTAWRGRGLIFPWAQYALS